MLELKTRRQFLEPLASRPNKQQVKRHHVPRLVRFGALSTPSWTPNIRYKNIYSINNQNECEINV